MRLCARGIGGTAKTFAGGEFESHDHAERHCLAVQQTAREATTGLERMAERVAKIEQRAFARLALVAGDDAGLGAAANGDRMLARRAA